MSDYSKLIEISGELQRQIGFAVHAYTFLKDQVDHPERFQKYRNSDAGIVPSLAILSVDQVLTMYLARTWDARSDAYSIPIAVSIAQASINEIVQYHINDFASRGIEGRDPNEFRAYLGGIVEKTDRLMATEVNKVIRVIRTEAYAHSLVESRDRKKLFPENSPYEAHSATRNDQLALARSTFEITGMLDYLLTRCSDPVEERIARVDQAVKSFWKLMPTFSEFKDE